MRNKVRILRIDVDNINVDEAGKLAVYNNTVFACMSPNDISKLEKDLENLLK